MRVRSAPAVTIRSSASGSTASPCTEASTAASTKAWRVRTPLEGALAVTTASRSPTTGSASQNTPVAPGRAAVSTGTGEVSSRPSAISSATTGAVGPIDTVQVAPSAAADTCMVEGTARRTAETTPPAASSSFCTCGRPWGVSERSSRALASNTIHTASPRRNTAAPSGAAQGKPSFSVRPSISARMATTPDLGRGSGAASAAGRSTLTGGGKAGGAGAADKLT